MSHILLVDDEEAICWALRRALEQEGHAVAVAASAEKAFELARQNTPDAILLDVRLPGIDGLSAMERLRQLSDSAPIVVMTAYGNLSTAVRAMEGGAFDYLAKPFDLSQALETVARAVQRRSPVETDEPTETEPAGNEVIVGRSPAMQGVFKRIALVAPRNSCVLITGESGTGKELVARAIHRHSRRRDRPFLPVHIAALNPNIVESELFGHVKGAFTGAAQSRTGLLALADGGTIFLDELADIPMPIQGKLLRVLEYGEVLPVGSSQPLKLDLRILGATNRDLSRLVAEGLFRQDLFFRLNVFQIHLPPLRERRKDIPLLAEHFLRQIEPSALPLPNDVVEHLMQSPWPGNVRELRNALEHAAILARGESLRPDHFPPVSQAPIEGNYLTEAIRRWLAERIGQNPDAAPSQLYPELIRTIEPTIFAEIIERVQGNRWEAARWLGLNRATVRKKLIQYGLDEVGNSE